MPAHGNAGYNVLAAMSFFSCMSGCTTAAVRESEESQILKSAPAAAGVNGGMFTPVSPGGIPAIHANSEPWLEDGEPILDGPGGCLGESRSGIVSFLRKKLSLKKALPRASTLDGGLTELGNGDGVSKSKFSRVQRKLLRRKTPATPMFSTAVDGPESSLGQSHPVETAASSNSNGQETEAVPEQDQLSERDNNFIHAGSETSPASESSGSSPPTPQLPDSARSSRSRLRKGLETFKPKAWRKVLSHRQPKNPSINQDPPLQAVPMHQDPLGADPIVHQDPLGADPIVHQDALGADPAVHQDPFGAEPVVHQKAPEVAPAVPVLCRGAPLGVAPEYQELVDMGFYGMDEAGVPAPGHEGEYDVEIPWGTDPGRIGFRHPDYGLVTLANAKQLMERMDDPTTASKSDLDKTLNRLAQTADFSLNMLQWAHDGVDPECLTGEAFGVFPMRAESVRWHVNGVISRDGVGQGDEEWREYLAQREAAHSNQRQENFDDDEEENSFVGMATLCWKCSRRWDTGAVFGKEADPECMPITKLVKFYCKQCHKSAPPTNGEVPLCMMCARNCLKNRLGYNLTCGHPLGLKVRAKPGRAYKNAVDSTR